MSQQINLFNPIFKQQKKYLSAATIAQALGMILLGSLLLVGYINYRSMQLQAQAAATDIQLKAAQDRLTQVAQSFGPRQKSKALELEILKTEAQMQSLQKVAATLQHSEFGNTAGYANYFRAFARQIVDGLWLTGFSIEGAGAQVALQGRSVRAELIPVYINRMKNEQVLRGKSFSNLEMHRPQATQASAGDANRHSIPGYIEFTLQSTGLSTSQAAAGGTGK